MNALLRLLLCSALFLPPTALIAQNTPIRHGQEGDLSLKLEIQRHLDRGLDWLESQQAADGSWGETDYPALTALALSAIMGNPEREESPEVPETALRGYDFLRSKVQPDGGIYGKGLATYNTSLSLMALIHRVDDPEVESIIREARRFLIHQQADFDLPGVTDNELDGGIGYGGTYPHSDLSNTHLAMEALYYSRQVLLDRPGGVGLTLDWDSAIDFVTRTQNVPQNDLPYVAVTDENRGGFAYFPGDSKAGEDVVNERQIALRSYGSMSYAGLLSFIYAEVDSSDPRVIAVRDWLGKNYTVAENPGLGAQGLFYYYHTMAKALAASGITTLPLPGGQNADWREDLALRLFDTQRPDGSWINEGSSRWWEDEPVLVTAYSLLALEHIARQL